MECFDCFNWFDFVDEAKKIAERNQFSKLTLLNCCEDTIEPKEFFVKWCGARDCFRTTIFSLELFCAGIQLITNPGSVENTFVFYGDQGCGKSLICKALGVDSLYLDCSMNNITPKFGTKICEFTEHIETDSLIEKQIVCAGKYTKTIDAPVTYLRIITTASPEHYFDLKKKYNSIVFNSAYDYDPFIGQKIYDNFDDVVKDARSCWKYTYRNFFKIKESLRND